MESLQFLLTAVIAFVAVLTGLGFVFNILLNPVKENQAKMENELIFLKENQAKIEKDISVIKEAVLANKSA